MRHSAAWSLLWIVVACAPRDPNLPRPGEQASESAPQSFFGIAGLTRTTRSGYLNHSWGTTMFSELVVYRARRVVCTLPLQASGTGEYGGFRDMSDPSLSSQQPVRFYLRHRAYRYGTGDTANNCIGFELPPDGDCHQAFDRPCSHEVCTPEVKTSSTPGTGTLRGHVTRALRPVVGATVLIGSYPTMSDEHGSFAVEAGPGSHALEVSGAVPDVQRTTVMVGAHEDVDVTIDIHCAQVADTSCCNF